MSPPETRIGVLKIPETVRFLLAGGAAALLNWLVRFPLSYVMPFAGAVTIANVIGMAFGFVAYRHFVFPGSSRLLAHQLRDFVVVNIFSMVVVVAVSVVFVSYVLPLMGLRWQIEAMSHAIGIAAGAVTNYFGHRQFSFANH